MKLKNQEILRMYDNEITRTYSFSLERDIENKKVSILSDTMFKCMFMNENRIKYSCKLLSYYLDISYEELLKVLKLGKNELDKKHETDKGERADYVAHIHDSIINIEINCNDNLRMLERNMEYAYRLYSKKVKRGSDYEYTQVIQLNINNFAFKNNDKIVDVYYIRNEEGIALDDKNIFIQIFIPNLIKKWYNEGVSSLNEAERYLLLLIETSIEESKKLAKGDTIMEEYVNDAINASNEEWFGEAYDKEWALKDQARRDGLEEGLEKGKKEGKKEGMENIIRKLNKKYGIDSIVEMTGLTEEEVRKYAGENAREEDFLGEAYDKEWALKDQARRDGLEEGMENIIRKLNKKYGIDSIVEMTGLTEEEVIRYVGENARKEDLSKEDGDKKTLLKHQKQIIQKMLEKDYTLKEISEITNLSIEEIKTYQKES